MKKRIIGWIVRMLILFAILAIVILSFSSCAGPKTFVSSIEPQLFTDDYNIRSLTFLTAVEVKVDTFIIPAKTIGKMREMRPNGRGGINMFIFDFLPKNGPQISLSFIRKELVEKKPERPRSFILRGKAELYENKKYRSPKILKDVSIPKGSKECVLLCRQQ